MIHVELTVEHMRRRYSNWLAFFPPRRKLTGFNLGPLVVRLSWR